jgi:hypothetical protein
MLATTTACSVGADDAGTGGPGTGSDDHNMTLGILCNSGFKITGTFAPGTPARPIDPDTSLPAKGCWPVGTWTFTATVDSATNECAAPPAVLPSYSFRVDRMDDGISGLVESRTSLTDAGNMTSHIAVSETGQGCEASFELGSADGKDYWNMRPLLLNAPDGMPPSTTLAGSGDYAEYNADAWPWK